MTWGWIPESAAAGMIFSGDAESSGTQEVNLELMGNHCKGLDLPFDVEFEFAELWDSDSGFYSALAEVLGSAFGVNVDPCRLCGAYALVLMEPNAHSIHSEAIESMDGVFDNSEGEFNGRGFLRFYSEEDGEIGHEACAVIQLG